VVKFASRGIWCDTCKNQFGKDKFGNWNPKAQVQAWITEISEGVRARGNTRSLCYPCAQLVTGDPCVSLESFTLLHIAGQQFQAKFTQGELIHV
jgi:hypothetical protein